MKLKIKIKVKYILKMPRIKLPAEPLRIAEEKATPQSEMTALAPTASPSF